MKEQWQVCTIEQLGTIGRGRSKHRPRNDAILFGGNYPFIQTGDIKKANLYITEYTETYNEVGLAQSKLWDKGTLCITIAANIAETAILRIKACFPDSVVGFKAFDKVADTRYVKYMMDMLKVYMQQISKGTTQDNLSLDKIRRVKFEVPPYIKQKRIADVLASLDYLIENNAKRIKLLEQMAENLYKEWFVRFRFPGYESAEFENGLPKGWVIKKVGELIDRLPYGKLYKAADVQADGDVIVIDQSVNEYVGFHSSEPSHFATVDEPIALFGDHSCKFQLMIAPFSLSENVIPYKAKEKNKLMYLYYAFCGLIETTEYKRHWSEFTAKKVLIAPIELQREFAENAKPMIELIQKYKTENRNLIKQRNLLLPRLMSGKLEVNGRDGGVSHA